MDLRKNTELGDENVNIPKDSYCDEISEFLQILTDTKTNEEKNRILEDYNKKLASFSEDEEFCSFVVQCLYGLYYNYENASLTTVSRTLFAFSNVSETLCDTDDCNCMFYLCDGHFLSVLRRITDVHTNPECQNIIRQAFYSCIFHGNLGLTRLLLKFGLFDFRLDVQNIILLENILEKFSKCLTLRGVTGIEVLVFRIRRSNFTFRRALLTFITIFLLAEYRMYERRATTLNSDVVYEELKCLCYHKFMCLNLFIDATNECNITSKDIKYFIETILNPENNARYFRFDLLESFEKLFGILNYQPRSLKDLTRYKIRSYLQNSSLLSDQINQLKIPDSLKKYLLFHTEGIWDMLKENYLGEKYSKSCIQMRY